MDSFVVAHEIPVQRFQKGDVKEDIAREHFKAAEREGRFGVVAWFERTLPDQLTLGRPDHAAILFGRRVNSRRPGRFTPPA